MKIMDFLSEKAISADLKATNKEGVIRELIQLLIEAGEIDSKTKEKLVKIILAREALGSTGVGQGVAIPHGKYEEVDKLVAAFGISKKGVEYDSLDGEPTYIFFLLVAAADTAGPHLKALARISRLLKDKFFRDKLRQASDEKTVIRIIKEEDKEKH
jgi:PTS system nitrogen regulatory IIA component